MSYKHFPLAAIAALVMVAGTETVIWQNRYNFWDSYKILGDVKREVLTSDRAPDTVAIFGVSRFYHLNPTELKAVFGQDAQITNYSWRWCGVEAYEIMLRALVRENRIPETILVDGMPEILGYKLDYVSALSNKNFQDGISEIAPARDIFTTSLELGARDWAWNVLSGFMTPPSVKNRTALVKAGHEFIKGAWPSLPSDYNSVVKSWDTDGFFVFAAGKKAEWQEFETLESLTGPYKLYKNETALQNFERFLGLAREHNIKVIMLPVPNNPLIFSRYTEEGVYSAYDRWLNEAETRYSNFRALEPRWLNWADSFGDAGHVHEAGARKHMDFILNQLRESNVMGH